MTNPNHTHITFLLDRSGSMSSLATEVKGGFEAFIETQRETEGTCNVTLAQFDNEYELVYDSIPISDVPPLVLQPRGMTALLDAMGKVITDTGAALAALPEDQRPGTVILAIMTDGQENDSHEWTRPAIKKLVSQQQDEYNWKVLYMGANQNAVEEGASFGVAPQMAMTYSTKNAGSVLRDTASNISLYRTAVAAGLPEPVLAYNQAQRDDAMR